MTGSDDESDSEEAEEPAVTPEKSTSRDPTPAVPLPAKLPEAPLPIVAPDVKPPAPTMLR